MTTYSMKASEINRKWYLIDATNLVLGRMAAQIAIRLRGKHKPAYTPHMHCGDHVIVINAEKIRLTKDKMQKKVYHRHTGHPGGLKSKTAEEILNGKYPERVIIKAVERMIPRTPLGRLQMKAFKVYGGATHPHTAQCPEVLDLTLMNSKNNRIKENF